MTIGHKVRIYIPGKFDKTFEIGEPTEERAIEKALDFAFEGYGITAFTEHCDVVATIEEPDMGVGSIYRRLMYGR